ncbi:MAG: ABC transporter ATP-binding protein [Oscillospiraceae bacterium]|nr:ABC transporter ATP-binding protein [Oscillospiraceae bacterium]
MIEFRNIHKEFVDGHPILKGVNVTADSGELMVLLGNSGSGKTTMLKMVNKLILPTSGSIFIDGQDISGIDEITLRRRIGYVIQEVGLFPHMTVKENIEIVGKIQKKPLDEIERNTKKVMEMIGLDLDEYLYRKPRELSGGQQQRIGVARALATDPDILLMDEPFSALDPITRVQLQDELLKIQGALNKTILFVTHGIIEAIKLADRICLINEGNIEQVDTPKNLLKHPSSDYVRSFMGKNRLFQMPHLLLVEDIMSTDIQGLSLDTSVSVRPDAPLVDALNILREHDLTYLPVLNDTAQPIGVLHVSDLLAVLSGQLA